MRPRYMLCYAKYRLASKVVYYAFVVIYVIVIESISVLIQINERYIVFPNHNTISVHTSSWGEGGYKEDNVGDGLVFSEPVVVPVYAHECEGNSL